MEVRILRIPCGCKIVIALNLFVLNCHAKPTYTCPLDKDLLFQNTSSLSSSSSSGWHLGLVRAYILRCRYTLAELR